MAKILEQVQKLIDMASRSDSNPNEARNAALKACRLIRLHGLRVILDVAEGAEAGAKQAVHDVVDEVFRRPERKPDRSGQQNSPAASAAADLAGEVVRGVVRNAIDEFVAGRRRK